MNNFLREARKFRNLTESICIVLGNESCDLDSAVSSLSLAYFYHKNENKIPSNNKTANVLPIFNIPRKEFPLKTEVLYFLNRNSIDTELITCKDEIDESLLKNNDIVLVDHHKSPWSSSVVAVHDHRPFDETSNLPRSCLRNIKLVGSCATLIADQILDLHNSKDYLEILRLLYGAIILDTVNFSKDADKATTLDGVVAFEIENLLELDDSIEYRELLFNDLVHARNDVNGLDSYQILFKDMKMLTSENGKLKVSLPGFPILVQDYIKLDNAEKNIKKFAEIQNSSVILLIGMKINNENDSFQRDLGLINILNEDLFNKIAECLKNNDDPNLELEEYAGCNFLEGKFFLQKNVKPSRKQIVPIIKSVFEKMQ